MTDNEKAVSAWDTKINTAKEYHETAVANVKVLTTRAAVMESICSADSHAAIIESKRMCEKAVANVEEFIKQADKKRKDAIDQKKATKKRIDKLQKVIDKAKASEMRLM